MRPIIIALAITITITALVANLMFGPKPAYDESADAGAKIASAIEAGKGAKRPILLIFGANWCSDCLTLDGALQSGATAALVNDRFEIVKIDVGEFDKNTDLAQGYGVPLQMGIPTIAVLSTSGKALYVTEASELANAGSLGDAGLLTFFTQLADKTKQ
jgi:thioredoxin 1